MSENKTRLYIASRFKNKEMIRGLVRALPTNRYEVVSTWHDLEDSADGSRIEAARRDISELDQCDAVLVITQFCESVPGGMHFEAGYAYAKGKKIYLLGPTVNIFYDYVAEHVDYGFYCAQPQ
jgi:nucleoside 2-deoxyribosyltransferase